MWVTSFSSSGAKINMTIKTDRDADNITSYIRNNPFFNTEDVRKRRNSDGSKYIYMRMTYRQTGKNNG
jgi:acyl-CoA hydrolase